MSPTIAARRPAAVDYERTLILSIEVSNQNWVLAAHRPKSISFTRSINMSSASEPLRASPPFIARRRLVRSGFQPDAYNQAK
jgi:hypothetical protein